MYIYTDIPYWVGIVNHATNNETAKITVHSSILGWYSHHAMKNETA